MKILMVTTVSGTINAFLEPHLQVLHGQGHRVDLACRITKPLHEGVIRVTGRIYDVPLHRSPLRADNLRALWQLREICKRENYDVVHVHTPVAAMVGRLAAAARRDTTIAYTAHGFHFQNSSPILNWVTYFPVEWLMSHWTDYLLTMNMEDEARARKYFKHPVVKKVPGVGLPELSSLEPQPNVARASVGLAGEYKMVLCVGELSRRKSIGLAIEAMVHTPNDFKLVIAGEGPQGDELKELATRLGIDDRVIFLGYRDDVAALLSQADVLVHSSVQEGLPVAVMEAMRAAVPVVGSNVRGLVDLIRSDSGVLVEGRAPADWGKAIRQVCNSDAYTGGPNDVEPFMLDAALESTVEVYSQIEASRKARTVR